MASATFNYNLPYPTNTDPVDITGDIQALAEALDSAIYGIGEISQDAAAAMITSASHVNGISASYDDVANRLTFTLAQNIATSASPVFSGLTLSGIPTAPTAAVNTNTTQIATTAFVVGQAGSASPVMDGTATVGTSLLYARQDHIHPTDTSRAPLSSPALTGTPTAPTASVDTSTTQLATTQFVVNQGYLKSASASTVYAPLSSPTFTGTVTAATLDLTTAATATTATSYWVETGSDGVVRPKTLANARTELVTTAAVNSASATVLGTVTNGTWNASTISATYIDSAIARLASPTFTGTPSAPTASVDTSTTQLATTEFVISQNYLKNSSASSTYLTQVNASATYLTQSSASTIYAAIEDFQIFEIEKDRTAVTASSQYTFRAPFAMTLTQIPRASLSVASSSGSVSLGITASGSNIFTTNLSIDQDEKTSITADVPAVLGITSIPNDSEIIFDVIDSGTGAEGLKVIMYYKRT